LPEEVVTTPAEVQEETAAPSSEEQNESTESATGEAEQQESQAEGEGQKSKGGFQRRIDKLTREKADKERELEYWRQQVLRSQPKDEPKEETPKAEDKPTRDKFTSDEEFVEALTDWKLNQRQAKQAQENEQKAAVQPLFEAREKFAATVDDFHDVMRAATDVPVTPNMLPYLQDPELGPELGYFLAKNPEEAKKLAKLGPVILAKSIVELQPRFKPDAPSAKTATVSKAPPPPNPVGRSASGQDEDISTTTDMDKYKAWLRKNNPDWDRA
jgi:hypothetical protein